MKGWLRIVVLLVPLLAGCQEVAMTMVMLPEAMIRRPIELWVGPGARHEAARPVDLRGVMLDEQGGEVDGAELVVMYRSTELGERVIGKTVQSQFVETVELPVYRITVSREGYFSQEFSCSQGEASLIGEAGFEVKDGAKMPLGAMRIVLRKQDSPLTTLERRMDAVWVDRAGTGLVIAPSKEASAAGSAKFVEHVEQAPAGYFYITTSRKEGQIPTVPLNHGPDCRCRIPEAIRIGVRGEGNGIQVFVPSSEQAVWHEMRQAPAEGYRSEITFGELEREQWRKNKRVWFFIKCQGRYGRGCIGDWAMSNHENGELTRYGGKVNLEMQADGSRNLLDDPGKRR